MAQDLGPFQPTEHLYRWETRSTAADGDKFSVYVSAEPNQVRVSILAGECSSAFKLTPAAARLLAAELIAAADSTFAVAEAA